MITDLTIENFKGHRDTRLSLKQLTMLVGDNGSGKTSVLEAIRLPDKLLPDAQPLAVGELLRRGSKQIVLSFRGYKTGQQ
jgi:predicted ATP-dependent endonuclease of OLD family